LYVLHEKIFVLMQKAGWIHNVIFCEKNGWRPVWTMLGAQRAGLLKIIIESQRLQDSDRAPVAFTVFALGGSCAGNCSSTDRGVLKFWRQCCEEIGLTAIGGDCLVFVRIILNWIPGEKAPVRFE
jgi:hypothetical protein